MDGQSTKYGCHELLCAGGDTGRGRSLHVSGVHGLMVLPNQVIRCAEALALLKADYSCLSIIKIYIR